MAPDPLTRAAASAATDGTEWRLVLGGLRRTIPTGSVSEGLSLASSAVGAVSAVLQDHVAVDVRTHALVLTVRTDDVGAVTADDADVIRRIDGAIGPTAAGKPTHRLELAIDAMDVAAVRRFWAAILGFVERDEDLLEDPLGQLPTVWFQQMDAPRPGRNRVHFDLSVPHDEADDVIAAALAAGGTIVNASFARAFWVIADPEGNEVCVCTWQDRDP